eukprot:g9484.t1
MLRRTPASSSTRWQSRSARHFSTTSAKLAPPSTARTTTTTRGGSGPTKNDDKDNRAARPATPPSLTTPAHHASRHRPNTRPPIRKGVVRPALAIPGTIPVPFYATNRVGDFAPRPFVEESGSPPPESYYGEVKSPDAIRRMRAAAEIAASSLVALDIFLKRRWEQEEQGEKQQFITTSEIDHFVQEYVMRRGAYPTGVNFHGFPRAICTSVNEVVVHGVPDDEPLQYGDIIN